MELEDPKWPRSVATACDSKAFDSRAGTRRRVVA